ncbi:hypothetical protein K1719_036283 [Acacia pycnantha]|nr:hypothetical protein K1719_036283 [Acacia pycnantha]
MWPDIIQKAKDGGLGAIETCVFWDHHEPVRRKYDFSGNMDFVKLFKLIQQAGLYGILTSKDKGLVLMLVQSGTMEGSHCGSTRC